MKNSIRILNVALLALLYCSAISRYEAHPNHAEFQKNSTDKETTFFSDPSTKLFCHTSNSENIVSAFGVSVAPDLKNASPKIWGITKAKEHLFKIVFAQYQVISQNFLIHFRKANLIFPFHNFW